MFRLGWQLARSTQVGDGLLFMKQGAAVYESLLAAEPDDIATRRLMAVTYGRIGDALLESTQQNAEALRMNEKSYELARDMAAADPRSTHLNKIMGVEPPHPE